MSFTLGSATLGGTGAAIYYAVCCEENKAKSLGGKSEPERTDEAENRLREESEEDDKKSREETQFGFMGGGMEESSLAS